MAEPARAASVSYRRVLAVALLVVLAVCLARFPRGSELAKRWVFLERSLSGKAPPPPAQTSRFWFDPGYAAFLEAVAVRSPPEASVSVLVPIWPDAYLYLAVYRLAPRRVVDARWMTEARVVAVYHTEAGRGPAGDPIPHGTLQLK